VKVALFVTCLADGLVPEVAKATVRVLERLGLQVEVPLAQTCCGQMHVNTGYPEQAYKLVRNHVAAFAPYDHVVSPSGSCVASARHQHVELAERYGDAALADAARSLVPRTLELSEFLVDVLGVTELGAYFPYRVTHHPTCHSLRLLRVGDRPTKLLREVDALELVELPDAETCCGFGGTFALKNSAVSTAMLADKLGNVASTGAAVCTSGDASCLLHIGGGLSRQGSATKAVHLAQILASTRTDPWQPSGAIL
jgi:L-lactate dehydrogenase complex protein LldE